MSENRYYCGVCVENNCIKCDSDYYCFDAKTGRCEINDEIILEDKKLYFKTNKEGNSCEI